MLKPSLPRPRMAGGSRLANAFFRIHLRTPPRSLSLEGMASARSTTSLSKYGTRASSEVAMLIASIFVRMLSGRYRRRSQRICSASESLPTGVKASRMVSTALPLTCALKDSRYKRRRAESPRATIHRMWRHSAGREAPSRNRRSWFPRPRLPSPRGNSRAARSMLARNGRGSQSRVRAAYRSASYAS